MDKDGIPFNYAVMQLKKILLFCGIFFVVLLTACGKSTKQEDADTYDEESLENQDWETKTDETGPEQNLSDEQYSSLYGTSPTMVIADDEFEELSSNFIGEVEASNEKIVEENAHLAKLLASGREETFFTSIYSFSKEYSLPDNDFARELLLYYKDCTTIKDLQTYIENEDWPLVTELVDQIRHVEAYLRCVALTSRSYLFSKKDDSISLDGYLDIAGMPEILDESDLLYQEAINLVDNPRVIYRFTIRYDENTDLYAYIVSCEDKRNHLLYVETTDGSLLSPVEQENGLDYNSPIEIIHSSDYDSGAWDNDITETTESISDEPTEANENLK